VQSTTLAARNASGAGPTLAGHRSESAERQSPATHTTVSWTAVRARAGMRAANRTFRLKWRAEASAEAAK
jgi:hypothetical protein